MRLKRPRNHEVAIELAPLVDVVFLLLIFFMVSTTFIDESRIGIELPEATTGEPPSESRQFVISIDQDGHYSINGELLQAHDVGALRNAMRAQLEANKDVPLVIVGDAHAPHFAVVAAMDVARELGIASLRIATRPAATDHT